MTDVLVLRGAPGAGKSTVLEALRPRLARGACFDLDQVWGMLGAVTWQDDAEHRVAVAQAARLVRGFLDEGRRPVVVGGVFELGALALFRARLGPVRVDAVALVLEADEHRRRLAGRATWAFHDVPRALAVNAAFLDVPAAERLTVTDVPAEHVARCLLRRLGYAERAASSA